MAGLVMMEAGTCYGVDNVEATREAASGER